MERLTKRMGGIEYSMCGNLIIAKCENCNNRKPSCYEEDCKTELEVLHKLAAYEDLGFTPEELQLVFKPPQEIYIIEYDEDAEENKVMCLGLDSEACIQLWGKSTFWNCWDEYDNSHEIPLAGLNKDYFLTVEAAEAALKGGEDDNR